MKIIEVINSSEKLNKAMFGFTNQNAEESQIKLKLLKKLYIFKLFNVHVEDLNK